jgi:hypothetical protein
MKKNIEITKFEILKESVNGNLVGGFSQILSNNKQVSHIRRDTNSGCAIGNNCHGANCIRCGGNLV